MATCAVCSRITALAVVAERAVAFATGTLLPVAALRLTLILIEVGWTGLVLAASHPVLLIKVPLGRTVLLRQTLCVRISELRLVVALVEVGLGVIAEIVGPIVGVHIVAIDIAGIDVVAVDVVHVNVIAIDIVHVDVAVVVIVAVDECIRVGDVSVVVINHGIVMPAAAP